MPHSQHTGWWREAGSKSDSSQPKMQSEERYVRWWGWRELQAVTYVRGTAASRDYPAGRGKADEQEIFARQCAVRGP